MVRTGKNINVATFTTLLNVTSDITNTSATDAFFRIYEKDGRGILTLRIIKTTKGSFRTVYKEVEESLNKTDLNEKFGWIC